MTKPFVPEDFRDEYQARLRDAIMKKIQGKEIVTTDTSEPDNDAGEGNESVVWVYPDQVCTVEYTPNTKNLLRQAVFKGFRTDMIPEDID